MKTLKKKEANTDQLGWVSFERTLLDSPIIKNSILSQIYLWCKLKANHKANWVSLRIGKGTKQVRCEKGQFITGRHKASDELGLPPSTYNNNIKKLKDFGYIEIGSNNHYSIITVIKYDCCADIVKPFGQHKENEKNNERTSKEQPKNTNNNIKNYKNDNSLNNKEKYNKFLSDPIFTKSDKNLFEEYKELVGIICSELNKVMSLNPQLGPEQFHELRKEYSLDQILRKIRDIEAWPKLTAKHKLFPLLQSFLARGSKKEEEDKEKDSALIPGYSLAGINDTDGNSKEEVKSEYLIYNDKINWARFNVTKENWKQRYISKWLRLTKYIQGSGLSGLKSLKQLTFYEFLILSDKYEKVFSLTDSEFEDLKEDLNFINNWKDINDYKTVGKAMKEYFIYQDDV